MRVKKLIAVTLAVAMAVTIFPVNGKKAEAINPVVQDIYTADPAPMVCSDGRLYLYTSHDEDVTVNGFFSMNDWYCYSTDDMVNWTDHGRVLGFEEFEWADENSSWAPQCVERDGKFYMYVPINKNGTNSIGVAVADSPTGPFEDAIGAPLLGPTYTYIDPTVWVDDDGQAYLYWGNPDLHVCVLNDDMISYDKSYGNNGIIKWELETSDYPDLESEECKAVQAMFGEGTRMDNGKLRRVTLYEEGPWFYKHGDYYYLAYAANGIPERLDYSMATSPLGPWIYGGMIMDEKDSDGQGTGSFTNHPGIVEYKGKSYLFYHTGRLYDGGGYHRSVAIEEITYNEDGTINQVDITAEGVEPVKGLDPYARVEAETIEYSNSLKAADSDPLGKYGIEKEPCSAGGVNLTAIDNEDYICIRNVDFTDYGAVKFSATTSADSGKDVTAGKIELYLDDMYGECLGEVEVKGGEAEDEWVTATIDIDKTKAKGTHDLYMVFTGEDGKENLFKFDFWQFTQDYVPTPSPVPTVNPTQTPSLHFDKQIIKRSQKIMASSKTITYGGKSIHLNCKTDGNGELTYESGNDDIASVSAIGEVEAKGYGKATIIIRASATEQYNEAVKTITVTVIPKTVNLKKVKSNGKKRMSVTWKKDKSVTGYQIYFSTTKKFKRETYKRNFKKTVSKMKVVGLKSKKTYYVKIRAYSKVGNKKYYGKWSEVKKVKIR